MIERGDGEEEEVGGAIDSEDTLSEPDIVAAFGAFMSGESCSRRFWGWEEDEECRCVAGKMKTCRRPQEPPEPPPLR